MADATALPTFQAETAARDAAARARLALPPERAAAVAAALRADVEALGRALGGVKPGPGGLAVGVGAGGMPLRADGGTPHAMARPLTLVAPVTRLGYVLVPRLAPQAVDRAATSRAAGRDAVAEDAFTAELAVGA